MHKKIPRKRQIKKGSCVMKKTNKLISLISAVAMIITMFSSMSVANAEAVSGKDWNFDPATGVLTITGRIENGSATQANPWKDSLTANVNKVVFAEGVNYVDRYLFSAANAKKAANLSEYEKAIEEVVFPSTIETISNDCFDGQTSLKKITWSDTPASGVAVSIGARAFKNVHEYMHIELPSNLGTLDADAFSKSLANSATGQYEITIPKTVTSITGGSSPFSQRKHIKRIVIEDGCAAVLGRGALTNLTGVEMVIPDTVTVEANADLMLNTALPSVIYTPVNSPIYTYVKGHAKYSSNITLKTMEELAPCVVTVGCSEEANSKIDVTYDKATKTLHFYKNANGDGSWPLITRLSGNYEGYANEAEHIVIHDGITEVESYAFIHNASNMAKYLKASYTTRFANVKTVTLPSTVTNILNDAFGNLGKLESINIPASVTSLGARAFSVAGYNAANSIQVNDTLKNIYVEGNPTLGTPDIFTGRRLYLHYGPNLSEATVSAISSKNLEGNYHNVGGSYSNGSKVLIGLVEHTIDTSLAVDGTTATATYKNWTASPIAGKFIVAAYDAEDRFISATIADSDISIAAATAVSGPVSGTASATVASGAAYYKAFVWDSMANMVPQAPVAK